MINLNKLWLLQLIFITLLISSLLFCQNHSGKNREEHKIVNLGPAVSLLCDSLLIAENVFNSTLYSNMKNKVAAAVDKFSSSSDSVYNSVKDSISLVRMDSLKSVGSKLKNNLITNSELFHPLLAEISNNYAKKINLIKKLTFDDLSDASDTLGNIDEAFRDAMTNDADEYYDNFKDSIDETIDSLGNYAGTLLDFQNDENDLLDSLRDDYYSYGLFGKLGYTSDMQYRGYKGATAQSALFPGLIYNHTSGFSAFINVYNIQGTIVPWDEIELGASYNHNFTDRLSLGLSYAHYSFNDTSEISKQGLNGIAGVNLSYEFPLLTAGTSFDVSFGDQTDYSLNIDISKRFTLTDKNAFQCWLEPGFSGIYGTESLLNEKITNKKNGKKKGVTVIQTKTKINSVFSVLDYQLSVPVTFQFGRLILTPEYDYNIPLNQPPDTDSSNFGFFTINLSVKIF